MDKLNFHHNEHDIEFDENQKRRGEKSLFKYRSTRFVQLEGLWYFTIRERQDIGPYSSREKASDALKLFIDCLQIQGTSVEYAVHVAKSDNWAVSLYL